LGILFESENLHSIVFKFQKIFQNLKRRQPAISEDFEQHDIYTNMLDIIDETRQRGLFFWN
jgi:hypothetical protein